MSELLDALIKERRKQASDYQAYLKKIRELATRIIKPAATAKYPAGMDTPAKKNLYDNLNRDEELVVRIDTAVRNTKKDNWRGHRIKELELKNAVKEEVMPFGYDVDQVFEIVKKQRDY